MAPWLCTHPVIDKDGKVTQSCVDCGVTKKFSQFVDCDALKNCQIIVPTKEWLLAKRKGKDKNNVEDNTQIELSDVELPVCLIVEKLRLQLDKCRKHCADAD